VSAVTTGEDYENVIKAIARVLKPRKILCPTAPTLSRDPNGISFHSAKPSSAAVSLKAAFRGFGNR
jgi:hypothetical protein